MPAEAGDRQTQVIQIQVRDVSIIFWSLSRHLHVAAFQQDAATPTALQSLMLQTSALQHTGGSLLSAPPDCPETSLSDTLVLCDLLCGFVGGLLSSYRSAGVAI